MNWNVGDGVALQYVGTAPDVGAFESGSTVAADNQAPATPGNPSAAPMSATQISLNWTASTDNVGVDFYNIYRCEGNCTPTVVLDTTTQTTYTDADLSMSTPYTYQLSAVDTSGNVSSRTNTFTGTTLGTEDPGNSVGGGGSGGSSGGSGCFIEMLWQGN